MSATTRPTRRPTAGATASAAAFLAVVLASPLIALAEDGATSPPPGDPHAWALWTSCSVFFAAVILFLVVTHRRATASVEKLTAMERRLDEAEKRR